MNLFDKQIYHYIAMYTVGFLILWVPGLIFFSKAALLAAGFNHIYIWVHYYTTELPDIRYIYGSSGNPGAIQIWIISVISRNDSTWFAGTLPDSHLIDYFGIMAEPLANDLIRYYIVTIGPYLHWTDRWIFI